MNKVVIAITGQRLLSPVQKKKVAPVLEKAMRNITFTLGEHDHATSFIAVSPLAEGADTLFAYAAKAQGLPLHVLLPFEREQYLEDFSSDDGRREFDALYDSVGDDNKKVLSSAAGKEIGDLYLALGQKLVDDADFVIAVWNQKNGRGKGGTADIVAFAMAQKKNILLINPEDEHPYINYLHAGKKYRDGGDPADIIEANHVVRYIDEKQREYDHNARRCNSKYKKVWATCFIIGLVEVLAFSLIISFHVSVPVHFLLALVELSSILSIILLLLFGDSKTLHSKYVHYRVVSERLRIKKFFSELGLRIYHITISPIYFAFNGKPEYDILDSTIRLINLSTYSYLPFEAKKQKLDDELIRGQHKYHKGKKEKYEKKNALYKKVRSLLFLLLLLAIILHFLHISNEFFLDEGIRLTTWEFPLFHYKLFEEIILFMSIFIPATIAACEALKYLYEWEKIITVSAAMENYFRDESKKLADMHTEQDLEVFLNSINKDMLIENLDWEKHMHDKNEVPI